MKEIFEKLVDWVKDSQDTITVNTFGKWFEATQEMYDIILKYMPSVNLRKALPDDTHRLLLMNHKLIVGVILLDWQYNLLESTYDSVGIDMTQQLNEKRMMKSQKIHKKSKSKTKSAPDTFTTPKEMIEYLESIVKKAESIEEKERNRAEYLERKRKNQADMMARKKSIKEKLQSGELTIDKQNRYNPDGSFNNGRYRPIAVNQFDLDGNFIKYWDDYHLFDCKQIGLLMLNCKGKAPSAYGYIWKYATNNINKNI